VSLSVDDEFKRYDLILCPFFHLLSAVGYLIRFGLLYPKWRIMHSFPSGSHLHFKNLYIEPLIYNLVYKSFLNLSRKKTAPDSWGGFFSIQYPNEGYFIKIIFLVTPRWFGVPPPRTEIAAGTISIIEIQNNWENQSLIFPCRNSNSAGASLKRPKAL